MNSREVSLVDLAASAGPTPEGVELTDWLIAKLPPGDLTRAAKFHVPTYETIAADQRNSGTLTQFLQETPLSEMTLGTDILLRQQRLSRTKRRLATAACAATLFVVGGGITEMVQRNVDQSMKQDGIANVDTNHMRGDLIAASISGLFGGSLAMLIGLGLSSRLAVGPAKKIVRQAHR